MVDKRDEKGNVEKDAAGKPIQVRYTRTLADGGTFTATQAKQFGLIDEIGDLPQTIRAAGEGLGSFKAVVYDRTPGLVERLTGLQIRSQPAFPDVAAVFESLTPRLWYLASAADGGILAAGR
jgi:ClpP class serine protease